MTDQIMTYTMCCHSTVWRFSKLHDLVKDHWTSDCVGLFSDALWFLFSF